MPAVSPPPKDVTKTEHVARVERVVFESPDGPFVILALADGQTAVGAAAGDDFDPGLTYRFLGKWEDDPRRGYRFRFGSVVVHSAHSRGGVVRYLADRCDGVGPKTADRLWTRYGSDAVAVLRDQPERVLAELGLNSELVWGASAALKDDQRYQHTRVDLHGLFGGRGFSAKLIEACVDRWGAKAAETVRRNPFRLLNMPSAGFKRCDKLYLDLGLNPAALKRQGICAAQCVILDRNGHTWLEADFLADRLQEMIPQASPVRAFRYGLRAKLLAGRRDEAGKLWLTTAARAYFERLIADSARRLAAAAPRWPADRVPVSQQDGDRLPSEHQAGRLRLATAGPVGLLTGGPGTGKSHSVAYLLKEIIAEHGSENVAVVAPTGKAAVRIRQSLAAAGLAVPTSTIHSKLMQCGRLGVDGTDADGMDGFEDAPAGMLAERFVVVDEASMVDANLMGLLLSACPTGTHVLFVGDPYQLPPVGHGSPLRDLIAAGLPCGELTQVRRNAGQIVHACLRVKNNESFETADRFDLAADPPRNLRLVPTRDEADAAEVLHAVLRSTTAFHPVWGTQVICARNKGGRLTRRELNEGLQDLLNADGKRAGNNPFRVGDKVICLKNSRQAAVELAGDGSDRPPAGGDDTDPANWHTVYDRDPRAGRGHREPKQVYVANGEIGRVLAVAPKVMVVRFSEGDLPVRVPMGAKSAEERKGDDGGADDEGRGCNFDLAYAVTCHKMQGSQAPFVIILGDPQAGGVATREWLYTAMSRPEKACMLIGPPGVFAKMAARQSTMRRKTFLTELLREADADAKNG